jgi:P27 family predicted phage terminase small subunit
MGRLPKPAALRAPGSDPQHKANGSLVPRAPNQIRRQGDPAPPAPEGLGARGSVEWNRIWQHGSWLQPDADYHWVAIICRAYDDLVAFRETVDAEGLTVTGYNGQTVAHPLIKEGRVCEQQIMKALSVLGFSPTDRARLGIQEATARKAIADLQNAQRNRRNAGASA